MADAPKVVTGGNPEDPVGPSPRRHTWEEFSAHGMYQVCSDVLHPIGLGLKSHRNDDLRFICVPCEVTERGHGARSLAHMRMRLFRWTVIASDALALEAESANITAPQPPTGRREDLAESWARFREAGALWLVNRTLHLYGWAIVIATDEAGKFVDAYPVRCEWRGFSEEREALGFARATAWMVSRAKA